MPLTIPQARTEILRRLGIPDDGANSPELLSQIAGMIGAIQRSLCLEHAPLIAKRTTSVAMTASRVVYPTPTATEGLVQVLAQLTGGSRVRLGYGLVLNDTLEPGPGIPARYDVRPFTGVASVTVSAPGGGYMSPTATFSGPGGSGTTATGIVRSTDSAINGVTITDPGSGYTAPPTITFASGGTGAVAVATLGSVNQLLIAPSPQTTGTLWIEYRPIPSSVLTDTDTLVFDDEAVLAQTAAQLAVSSKHQLAEALVYQRDMYMTQLLRRAPMRPLGGGFSLAGQK